jgi:putative acetyltransferase
MHIQRDPVSHSQVIALLQTHLRDMAMHSPPESVHALHLDALRAPDVFFFSAWEGEALMGFGALKRLDAQHGELKSMRTATRYLGQGVAATLLRHLLTLAGDLGLSRVSLETGSAAVFSPARRLYARFGFVECGPFGDYAPDPYSVFMTRALDESPPSKLNPAERER